MDDLNCCLSQVIRLCLEASIFLNQLYKFENELSKFYSSSHIPSRKYFFILEQFSIIINDLNFYYKNTFVKLYSNTYKYLLRKHFTVNDTNILDNDFCEDLNHLNYILKHQKKYYENIFYYLHKLSITCSLCIQYRRSCSHSELANRFIVLRLDLLFDLQKLNQEIQFLLSKINRNFRQRRQISIKSNRYQNERITISNLLRTIFLWFILIFSMGYFLFRPLVSENQSKNSWLL